MSTIHFKKTTTSTPEQFIAGLKDEFSDAVMKEATEVPGMGSFTIITDPTGAMLGLWEPKKA